LKKQIAVLAFAILLVPFIPFMNAASAQGVSYAALHSVQFIGYAPGTLVISYPHTTTVNSNISSLSGGRYTYKEVTSSPFSTMTFSLNASDIYTIYFVIQYPIPESGNLSWTLNSPGYLPQTGDAYVNNATSVALTFVAALLNPQTYPTADQIANATAAILINKLTEQNALQQQEINTIKSSTSFQDNLFTAFVTIALVIALVAIVLVRRLWTLPRR